MKLYEGTLSYDADEDGQIATCGQFGEVANASIVKHRFTGQSPGFGFVEMPNATEAQAAIDEMNGKESQGRRLTVSFGPTEAFTEKKSRARGLKVVTDNTG